jgi:hypothetical protein
MANRQPFPRAVIREIARRAVNAIGVKCCENCGAVGVPLQRHHLKMDAMQTPEAKQRKLTAADGAMFCKSCHDPETACQRTLLAKVERVEAAHWLPRLSRAFQSRGFAPSAKPKRPPSDKITVRRPIYEEMT